MSQIGTPNQGCPGPRFLSRPGPVPVPDVLFRGLVGPRVSGPGPVPYFYQSGPDNLGA